MAFKPLQKVNANELLLRLKRIAPIEMGNVGRGPGTPNAPILK